TELEPPSLFPPELYGWCPHRRSFPSTVVGWPLARAHVALHRIIRRNSAAPRIRERIIRPFPPPAVATRADHPLEKAPGPSGERMIRPPMSPARSVRGG